MIIKIYHIINDNKCIEGPSHYLDDKQDFDVSSESPSSGKPFVLFIAKVVRRSFDTFAVIYPLPALATV